MSNSVFVGTSLDGYIADRDGGLGFLETVPNPEGLDHGFTPFMDTIDAILMGRNTLEIVMRFDIPWPYTKPIFVLSTRLKTVPDQLEGKIEIVTGDIRDVVNRLKDRGYKDLYIDGGKLIQSFLAADMVDELTISQIPILIGGGTPLFGGLSNHLEFELVKSEVLLEAIVQSHYRRKR